MFSLHRPHSFHKEFSFFFLSSLSKKSWRFIDELFIVVRTKIELGSLKTASQIKLLLELISQFFSFSSFFFLFFYKLTLSCCCFNDFMRQKQTAKIVNLHRILQKRTLQIVVSCWFLPSHRSSKCIHNLVRMMDVFFFFNSFSRLFSRWLSVEWCHQMFPFQPHIEWYKERKKNQHVFSIIKS